MPQLSAGKKALRASTKRRAVNDAWRKKLRESSKAIREAIALKDGKEIMKVTIAAESILDRAARRNIIHPNEAARKKSRLRKIQAQAK